MIWRITAIFILGTQYMLGTVLGGNGTVLQMGNDNFDQIIKGHKLVIVAFGAYWFGYTLELINAYKGIDLPQPYAFPLCRFSQLLSPVWVQVAQVLGEERYKQVAIGAVECEIQKELASKWSIRKYPTIKIWNNGELLPKEYRGARTLQHFKEYIDDMLAPAVHEIDGNTETKSIGAVKKAVVGIFKDKETSDYKVFSEVAESLGGFCKFHVAHNMEVLGLQAPMPHIMFKQNKQEAMFNHQGEGSLTKDALLEWSTEHCRPLVDEINFENGEEMTEEGLPFFILFTHPDDIANRQRFIDAVKKNMMKERGSIKFLVADGHQFDHALRHMGKTQDDLPVLVLDSFEHMYDFGPIANLEKPGYMQGFINDLHTGKLHHDFHHKHATIGALIWDKIQKLEELHKEVPPDSELTKLAPSKKRYSFKKDEL